MASVNCSVFSLFVPSYNSIARRRSPPLIIVSSFPSSKVTYRKNHLRPKILKTPNPKPYPPPPTQEIPEVEASQVSESEATTQYNGEFEDLQVSQSDPTTQYNGVSSGNLSTTDFFKYGAIYMLGGFVCHAIYSFWFLSNYYYNNNSNHDDGDLEIPDGTEKRNLSFNSNLKDRNLEIDAREKRNFLFNGNGKTMPVNAAPASNVDKLEMEKKIEQIKLMAREARRAEEMKKEQGEAEDSESDDESPLSSSHRLGIEREIGAHLSKLQDRTDDNTDISEALQIINTIGSSVKHGLAKDANKNVNQGNEALMFKKKFKFKSSSTKSTKTPKGFGGTQDRRASGAKKRDSACRGAAQDCGNDAIGDSRILYDEKQENQQRVVTQESVSRPPLEGGVQEAKFMKSAPEVIQSRKWRTQSSQGSAEENQDTGPIFEKDDVHGINGSSRHGLAEKTSAANRDKVKQANTKTDMWWLNLHYVLVILMQRDSSGGQKALYKLKFTSQEQDQGADSYIVAFEDHGDANNFCVLLESFFEDLDDFSAYPVPMTIKELNEEIASHAKKVVVVKKRQLQLYVGQPFTDVEMALHSLIEQDQNVP